MDLGAEGRERRTVARRLRWRLRPRDARFNRLFDRHAALCVDGLRALAALLADVNDPDGRVRDIEATLRTLGFQRMNQTVELEDSPTVRGMVRKVSHLVRVEEVAGES